jgi:hypothetical protein
MFSMIGVVMLMGLVTKNAILLVDFAIRAREDGMDRAPRRCCRRQVRLRPILMTTLAMVFGMVPLAFALTEGSEQRAPMGQAVIGGVITSSLLTLVVVPVIYCWLDDLAAWARRLSAGPGAAPAAPSLPSPRHLESWVYPQSDTLPRPDPTMNTELARFNMIEQQIRPWDVLDPHVLSLLATVRRETSCRRPAAMAFVDTQVPLVGSPRPDAGAQGRGPAAAGTAGAAPREGAGSRHRLGLHGRAAGAPRAAGAHAGVRPALAQPWPATTCAATAC